MRYCMMKKHYLLPSHSSSHPLTYPLNQLKFDIAVWLCWGITDIQSLTWHGTTQYSNSLAIISTVTISPQYYHKMMWKTWTDIDRANERCSKTFSDCLIYVFVCGHSHHIGIDALFLASGLELKTHKYLHIN